MNYQPPERQVYSCSACFGGSFYLPLYKVDCTLRSECCTRSGQVASAWPCSGCKLPPINLFASAHHMALNLSHHVIHMRCPVYRPTAVYHIETVCWPFVSCDLLNGRLDFGRMLQSSAKILH